MVSSSTHLPTDSLHIIPILCSTLPILGAVVYTNDVSVGGSTPETSFIWNMLQTMDTAQNGISVMNQPLVHAFTISLRITFAHVHLCWGYCTGCGRETGDYKNENN
jgi:hypothetical protein